MIDEEQEITAPLEADALQEGWAAKTNASPRLHAYLAFGAKTDLGRVRENNEDKFDFLEPEDPSLLASKGRLFAVADGMGGHSAGQVASELSLNIFMRSYFADASTNAEASLKRAAREANAYVVDVARTVAGRNGMGATLTAVAVRDDDMYVTQVGDSRCYLLRGGELQQITEDHSWVAEQVRAGTMSLADAEQSPFRNVITRSMGGAPEVEPDIYACKLEPGDRYLLCSDGLSGMVPHEELLSILAQGSPSLAAWNLIERANQYGGKDNITALILHVADIQPWPGAEESATESAHEVAAAELAPNGKAGEEGAAEVSPLSDGVPLGFEAAVGNGHATGGAYVGSRPDEPPGEPADGKSGFMRKLFRR